MTAEEHKFHDELVAALEGGDESALTAVLSTARAPREMAGRPDASAASLPCSVRPSRVAPFARRSFGLGHTGARSSSRVIPAVQHSHWLPAVGSVGTTLVTSLRASVVSRDLITMHVCRWSGDSGRR